MSQMDKNDLAIIIARIDQKFDDFKEVVVERLSRIEKKYDDIPTLSEKIKSQWFHILGLWTVIGSYIGYLVFKR